MGYDSQETSNSDRGSEVDLQRQVSALYRERLQDVYRAALGLLGSVSDAEDAVQELFRDVLRFPERYLNARHDKSYLLKCVRNICLKLRKNENRELRKAREYEQSGLFLSVPSALDAAARGEGAGRLNACLARLPEDQREAVVFRIVHQLSFEDIGVITDAPPKTVQSRVRLGLAKLKDAIHEQ